jgi:S1-C subfamily serine protease
MAVALDELEELISHTAETAGSSVVGLGHGWGRGTGVVIAPGRVLTCAHVLRDDEAPVIRLADGSTHEASVRGADPVADLAVLDADTGDVAPLAFAEGAPSIGQTVLALGNPGGRGLRVTIGHISSVGQRVRGPRGRRGPAAIEHTAPLPRGSSGGPLLDRDGRVLALNAVRTEGGLILAVPADSSLVERLSQGDAPQRAVLGVAVAPPRAARQLRGAVGLPDRDGLLVRAVKDGSPAAAAGVRRGDLIIRLGDAPTPGIDALHAALDTASAEPFELGVVRGVEELSLAVTLS